MDQTIISALQAAGIPTTWEDDAPVIYIERTPEGPVAPATGPITVAYNDQRAQLTFKPLRELFTGDRKAPDLSGEPPREYQRFIALVELAVLNFCAASQRVESDQEMERVFSQLRRRPDGRDPNKMLGYVRAAFQLYMSVHDVSQAQFEAVIGRLIRSTRTFSEGHISRNYLATLAQTMMEQD